MIKIFLAFIICMSFIPTGRTQDFSAFFFRKYINHTDTLNYRILLPEGFDPHKSYPLIIFLHGAGERGNDNKKQLNKAAWFFLKDSIRKKTQAIVIFPQCPAGSGWSYFGFHYDSVNHQPDLIFTLKEKPSLPSRLIKQLSDSLIAAHLVDPSRLYIGGLSLGGFGTYDFIERYPGYFAAAFPICGGGDTSYARTIAGKTAVWIFHGSSDPIVNVKYARQYNSALKHYGASVKYTEFSGVRHNSWDQALSEPGLIEWLMRQKTPEGITSNLF